MGIAPATTTGTFPPTSGSGNSTFGIEDTAFAKTVWGQVRYEYFPGKEQSPNDNARPHTRGTHQLRCPLNVFPTTAPEYTPIFVSNAIEPFKPHANASPAGISGHPSLEDTHSLGTVELYDLARGQLGVRGVHAPFEFIGFLLFYFGDARELLDDSRENNLSGTSELLQPRENASSTEIIDQPSRERSLNPRVLNLSDLEVRKRLTPSAVNALQQIFKFWQIGPNEALELLGEATASTASALEQDGTRTLDEEQLRRIACLLEIFDALNALYSDADLADKWIRTPNSDPIFRGITPLEFMKQGGLPAFTIIERYLNAY